MLLVWFAALLALWLPGFVLRSSLDLTPPRDPVSRLALEIGLGLASWPVLLLFTTAAGFHWSQRTARTLAGVLAVTAVLHVVRDRRSRPSGKSILGLGWTSLFAGVSALVFATRWSHARELALPAWVDSVHHVMLGRLIVEQGSVPETYAPFITGGAATYHYGFHAGVAWIAWLLGWRDAFDLAQLVLQLGQLLNALFVVALYAAGRELFASRRAGLLAAVLGTLVLWYPAYYVAWGRYPQLEGLLVLPSFLILVWQLARRPAVSTGFAAAILGAGLFLIHVRVALFGLLFALLLAVVPLRRRAWRALGSLAAAAAVSGLLVTPWIFRLLGDASIRGSLIPGGGRQDLWREYNAVPWDLVWSPNVREVLSVATAGITGLRAVGEMPAGGRLLSGVWCIGILALLWRAGGSGGPDTQTRRLVASLSLLGSWCLLTGLLLNVDRLGLPPLRIVPNSAAVIAFFLPLSLAAGGLLGWALGRLSPRREAELLTPCVVAGLAIWGAAGMTEVVAPKTVLAEEADVRALRWVRANLPARAILAVRVFPWLGGTFAGADAGYWIPVLADRASILPPSLYALGGEAVPIERRLLAGMAEASSLDDPALRALLLRAGITHLYLGARGGKPAPGALLGRPYAKVVYRDGPIHVFELRFHDQEPTHGHLSRPRPDARLLASSR